MQHGQHLRLRPGNGLALVAHERTVIVAVHRRQREIQASSSLVAVPVIGAFKVHHLLLAVPVVTIAIARIFLIDVPNIIPIPVRFIMLHAKGIHDLLLPVPVAVKVPGHHVDHKDLFLVGLVAVVLLVLTVGRNSSQILQTVVTVYRIETTAQKHLFRISHALRRRTGQGHRWDQLILVIHNTIQQINSVVRCVYRIPVTVLKLIIAVTLYNHVSNVASIAFSTIHVR